MKNLSGFDLKSVVHSKMKKIIPLDSFTVLIPDTADEVVQRLRQCLFYQGTFSEQGFKITRNYYRAGLTLIQGHFETQSHQTAVHIKMSIHPMFIASLGFVFLVWYGIAVPNAFESATYIYAKPQHVPISSSDGNVVASAIKSVAEGTKGTMPSHLAAMYLGLPIVMLIIFWLAFRADAKRIRRELSQIIQGK
ncbi:hypothetical protein [Calothrix sp. NIES-2098]|uniref:hypothetical protein n=1 Tax=Calothrix sp. NIES-2098 TaxID=1954171 RepID=UPI0030D6E2EB